MATDALSQLLLLLTSFALAALLWLMLLIARFYHKFTGEVTHHRWFLIPIVAFSLGAIRYSSVDRIGGDPLADLLTASAGLMLAALSIRLFRRMTHHRDTA